MGIALFLLDSFKLRSFDEVIEGIGNILPVSFREFFDIFQALEHCLVPFAAACRIPGAGAGNDHLAETARAACMVAQASLAMFVP